MKPFLMAAILASFASVASPCWAQTWEFPVLGQGRSLQRDTDLTRGGIIIVPRAASYRPMAEKLRVALQAAVQADYPVESGLSGKLGAGQVVIALGNMSNNPVLESLYWNLYTGVDPGFPGARGFVIQTVSEPLPLLQRQQVVILGGSHPATVAQAVDTFIEDLRNRGGGVLPPLMTLHGLATKDRGDAQGEGLRGFRNAVDAFRLTGDRKYVAQAYEKLRSHYQMTQANPAWELIWGDEIDSWRAVQAWDLIQEFGGQSEAETRDYDRMFLELMNKLVLRTEIFATMQPGPVIAWNHTSIPLLGLFTISRYLQARYGCDLHEVMQRADTYFGGQKDNYRISCDAFNYAQFSLQFVLAYYAMTGQWEYFDNGNARKAAELLLAQVDNNGQAGGTGDSHDVEVPGANHGWEIMDFKLKLPELLWFKGQWDAQAGSDYDRLWFQVEGSDSAFRQGSRFHPDMKAERPDRLAGSVAIPLDRGLYDHLERQDRFRMVDLAALPKLKPTCDYDKTFDKLQFRSFTPRRGEYILVDGFGQGNHGHMDTGAIICCTLDGYRFLYDADYLVAKSSEHNMVTVLRDGAAGQPVPPLAGLEDNFNFNGGAYAEVCVDGYNGMRWERHLLWLAGRYFVIFDTLQAEAAGNYRADCVWKVVNRGMEDYDGRDLTCRAPSPELDKLHDFPPATFRLRSVETGEWDEHISESGFPTRQVRQRKTIRLAKGESLSFQNLFYLERPEPDGGVAGFEPAKLGENALLVKARAGNALVVVGGGGGGVATDARFLSLAGQEMLAANVSEISVDGIGILRSSAKVHVRMNGDRLEIQAKASGRLVLGLATGDITVDYAAGKTQEKLPPGAVLRGLDRHLLGLAGQQRAVPREEAAPATYAEQWRALGGLKYKRERDMRAGDIDDDGANEVIVATDNRLICLNGQGQELWSHSELVGITSCATLDLDNGGVRVIAGTADARLLGFTAAGKLVRQAKITIKASGEFGVKGNPWVTHLQVRDLDGDGMPEIIAGLRSWQLHVFDAQFRPRWHNSMILHGVADLAFGPAPHGGDFLYAGDKYGGSYRLEVGKTPEEERCRGAFNGIGDVALAIADVDGDGVDDVISASDQGRLTAFSPATLAMDDYYPYDAPEWKPLWRYNSYGFSFSGVTTIGAGEPAVVASSEGGYLYYLRLRDGAVRQIVDVTEGVSVLAGLDDQRVLIGGRNGGICVVDAAGKITKRAKLSGRIVKLEKTTGGILALDAYGLVVLLVP